MTVFETYGTNTYAAGELSSLLADRLAVTFTERESHYRGIYFRATLADATRLQVQPNAIPGDDDADDLYDDEHPDVSVLLLVTTPATAEPLDDEIAAIEGLTKIASSRS